MTTHDPYRAGQKAYTERYRIFVFHCREHSVVPTTVEYAAWINAGSHAFRKHARMSPTAPIGRSHKFTEFLRTWGWYGITF